MSQRAGGRTRLFFSFLFIYLFISFILLVQFNFVLNLTFLKDARTRRLPESTARSSRARSHGLTGPLTVRLCDPYVLARPRTISTDAPKNPSMLAPSQQNDRFAGKVGFSLDLESTRMWAASLEKAKHKTTHLGICDFRSFWLQVPGFPHARPRMYRIEVGVAACTLIEAHSHTLSSFIRRIKL